MMKMKKRMKKMNKKKTGERMNKKEMKKQVKSERKASNMGRNLGLDSGKSFGWLFGWLFGAGNKKSSKKSSKSSSSERNAEITRKFKTFRSRKWEGVGDNNCLPKLILILLISLSLFTSIILVSALTYDEKTSLQSELSNLTSQLSDSGYDWLVNYNLKNRGML